MARAFALFVVLAAFSAHADDVNTRIVKLIYLKQQIQTDIATGKDVGAEVKVMRAIYDPVREQFIKRSPGFAYQIEEILYQDQNHLPMSVLALPQEERTKDSTVRSGPYAAAFSCYDNLTRATLFLSGAVYDWQNRFIISVDRDSESCNPGLYLLSDKGYAFVSKAEATKQGCRFDEDASDYDYTYAVPVTEPVDFLTRKGEFLRNKITVLDHLMMRAIFQDPDYVSSKESSCKVPALRPLDETAHARITKILVEGISKMKKNYLAIQKLDLEKSERLEGSRRGILDALKSCEAANDPQVNEAIQRARADFEISSGI